jgi:hypothetical protein
MSPPAAAAEHTKPPHKTATRAMGVCVSFPHDQCTIACVQHCMYMWILVACLFSSMLNCLLGRCVGVYCLSLSLPRPVPDSIAVAVSATPRSPSCSAPSTLLSPASVVQFSCQVYTLHPCCYGLGILDHESLLGLWLCAHSRCALRARQSCLRWTASSIREREVYSVYYADKGNQRQTEQPATLK